MLIFGRLSRNLLLLVCFISLNHYTEVDSPPLRTECVGTSPRSLKFPKLSQKGTTNGLPTIPRMGPITPTSIHTEHGCVTNIVDKTCNFFRGRARISVFLCRARSF